MKTAIRRRKRTLFTLTSLALAAAALVLSAPMWLALGASASAARLAETTTVMYDGSLGGTPDSQNFLFINLPQDSAEQTFAGGVTTLDTTLVDDSAYAGYLAEPGMLPVMPVLDRNQGYRLDFSLQIFSEAHSSSNRAGFSLIVLDQEMKGIELAFWENEIWAQHDDSSGSMFTHGEGTAFDTTSSLHDYSLIMLGSTYTLTANGAAVLSGPIRDYTAFSGMIDPYETPNFLFLGDDTTSARAAAGLAYVAVITAEPPPTATPEPSSTPEALYSYYLPVVRTYPKCGP